MKKGKNHRRVEEWSNLARGLWARRRTRDCRNDATTGMYGSGRTSVRLDIEPIPQHLGKSGKIFGAQLDEMEAKAA
jgi:hypothetical protein